MRGRGTDRCIRGGKANKKVQKHSDGYSIPGAIKLFNEIIECYVGLFEAESDPGVGMPSFSFFFFFIGYVTFRNLMYK
jgi:hypothetical protein